jgi:hypothetical protein
MNLSSDIERVVAEINADIKALNDYRAGLALRVAALKAKLAAASHDVILRLENVELEERTLVTKHPLLALVAVVVLMAISFFAGAKL